MNDTLKDLENRKRKRNTRVIWLGIHNKTETHDRQSLAHRPCVFFHRMENE